jgi:hypothetical protein
MEITRPPVKSKPVMKCEFMLCVVALLFLSVAPDVHAQKAAKLSPVQRQAAFESIQTMRRLISAVQVGPSFPQYESLLIQTKIVVDERLSILRGEMRVLVSQALAAFTDAHELWRIAINSESVQHYILYSCKIFQRYSLFDPQTITPINCSDGNAVSDAFPSGARMYHTSWRQRLLDPQLGQIWATSAERLDDAQKLLAASG